MKKVVIVHCWDGYPEYCWYPKVKSQLEEKGFEVVVPENVLEDMEAAKKRL